MFSGISWWIFLKNRLRICFVFRLFCNCRVSCWCNFVRLLVCGLLVLLLGWGLCFCLVVLKLMVLDCLGGVMCGIFGVKDGDSRVKVSFVLVN